MIGVLSQRFGALRSEARTLSNRSATAIWYSFLDTAADWMITVNRYFGKTYVNKWWSFDITWFDHRFDHLCGPNNWYWCERGVYGNKVIQPGDAVLDLCCGDGLYSGLFYATKAGSIDAIDRDERAIDEAKRRYQRTNITFLTADVLEAPFPRSEYDVVCLFAAIEHFPAEGGNRLLQKIAASLLQKNGVLVGSTPIFSSLGGHNREHQNEFLSVDQLRGFLQSHFSEVDLWCSQWPSRTECYFDCRRPIVAPAHIQ